MRTLRKEMDKYLLPHRSLLFESRSWSNQIKLKRKSRNTNQIDSLIYSSLLHFFNNSFKRMILEWYRILRLLRYGWNKFDDNPGFGADFKFCSSEFNFAWKNSNIQQFLHTGWFEMSGTEFKIETLKHIKKIANNTPYYCLPLRIDKINIDIVNKVVI